MKSSFINAPDTIISIPQFELDLLAYLVHEGINDVRISKGVKPLNIHPILKKAAEGHNDYQIKNNKITHIQSGTEKRNIHGRINFFGGGFQRMGENVLFQGFMVRTWSDNRGKEIVCPSYCQLAEDMVAGWVNSPGHYRNLIDPLFESVGTAVGWSDRKGAVFATQVFGLVVRQPGIFM